MIIKIIRLIIFVKTFPFSTIAKENKLKTINSTVIHNLLTVILGNKAFYIKLNVSPNTKTSHIKPIIKIYRAFNKF